MYSFFNEISVWLSQPFLNVANSLETLPILFAFTLGLVGALAPCQFTGNISAIMLYGNDSLQSEIKWKNILCFIFWKIVAFSILGLLIWLLGSEIKQNLTFYFPWLRKIVGPMLIIIGIFMLGLIKIKWTINLIKPFTVLNRHAPYGSFFLGFSLSLAFCPTMFILFFVTLMPVALSSSYGFVLPPLFAIGTAIPLLLSILLIWYLGISGALMKKGRRLGVIVQRIAGGMMILLGILDTVTYWS